MSAVRRGLLVACLSLVATALASAGAAAEPTKPVAVFVDVSEQHIPPQHDNAPRQFDVNGLPVTVGTGPTNGIGLRAGHGLDLGGGFSVDGSASLKRSMAPGTLFSPHRGMNDMAVSGAARYQQSGWDIALFPGIGAAKLDASELPNYAFGGSVARQVAGWGIETSSHYEVRRTDTLAGNAGTAASGQFGFTKLPLLGAKLDLGYSYAWTEQARAEAATLAHGPAVDLGMDLSDALQCRVGYRYEFAGDVRGTGPNFAWLGDGGQDFTVGWDWDLATEGLRGTTLTADFAYHQDFFGPAEPAVGSGGINFATAF